MINLETKIPPPIVALGVGTLMWLASFIVPPIDMPYSLRLGIMLFFVLSGLSLGLAGILAFKHAQTTLNPTQPATTSALVRTGIFRYTRNPMYLGLLLVLLGWAAFLSNVAAFAIAPVFVLYINRCQILPEERVLTSKFGADFAAYKNRVRRWL